MTYEQRCQIYTLKATGLSQAAIARQLSITRSTLSRELKRNTGKRGYRYQQAQQKARERRSQASKKPRRMTEEVVAQIEADLREEWSPVQIEGRLKQEGYSISHERIYQHVWFDKKQGGTLYTHLIR